MIVGGGGQSWGDGVGLIRDYGGQYGKVVLGYGSRVDMPSAQFRDGREKLLVTWAVQHRSVHGTGIGCTTEASTNVNLR